MYIQRKYQKFLKYAFWYSNMFSTNHQLTLHPYHRPFMVQTEALSIDPKIEKYPSGIAHTK